MKDPINSVIIISFLYQEAVSRYNFTRATMFHLFYHVFISKFFQVHI